MSKNNQKNRESRKRDEMAKPDMREARKQQERTHRNPNGTTPVEVTDEIRDFCTILADVDLPEVRLGPPPSGSKFSNCYKNFEERVAAEGCEVVYGAMVMKWPSVLLEAQFRAVWQVPDGRLGDVTPASDGEGRVLFLRDRKRRYQDRLIPSRQRALTDDAREYVRLASDAGLSWRKGVSTRGKRPAWRLGGASRREYEPHFASCELRLAKLAAVQRSRGRR
jgi:hypothetical protein